MKTKKSSKAKISNLFAALTMIICLVIGFLMWKYVMGNPANFEGYITPDKLMADPSLHQINPSDSNVMPVAGNLLGMIFKGGYIVPVLMGMLLMALVFSIERYFAITKAEGKGNLSKFVQAVKAKISGGQMADAKEMCDKQKGSVANVVRAALVKYDEVTAEGFDSDKAAESLGKEIEEATSLEMPALQNNMTIISTLVSLGTLFGLLGTVTGMIRAFSGLAHAGTPDQAALATGISEALVNTATGIATSIIATISYNYFTSKIDTLTYFIDEAGATITETYRKLKGQKK